MKFILASTSKRRKEILESAGFVFGVVPSEFYEDMTQPLGLTELAETISLGKAKEIFKRYPQSTVLGADTFVVLGEKLYGKPTDRDDAKRMLLELSGKKHRVITGVSILSSKGQMQKTISSYVTMNTLLNEQIEHYLNNYTYLDKAGAYAIQNIGKIFINNVEGSYTNVIGLPIDETKEMLADFGIFPSF